MQQLIVKSLTGQHYTAQALIDRNRRINGERDITISFLFNEINSEFIKDTEDWRLKRDVVYKFFRRLGAFYIAEQYQPHKLLKVVVDGNYNVDRPITRWGLSEIPLKVLDTPFKRSLYTSLTLNDEGAQFNDKWSAGMGILTDSSTWVS